MSEHDNHDTHSISSYRLLIELDQRVKEREKFEGLLKEKDIQINQGATKSFVEMVIFAHITNLLVPYGVYSYYKFHYKYNSLLSIIDNGLFFSASSLDGAMVIAFAFVSAFYPVRLLFKLKEDSLDDWKKISLEKHRNILPFGAKVWFNIYFIIFISSLVIFFETFVNIPIQSLITVGIITPIINYILFWRSQASIKIECLISNKSLVNESYNSDIEDAANYFLKSFQANSVPPNYGPRRLISKILDYISHSAA